MVCALFAESLPMCFCRMFSAFVFFLIECAGGFVQMRCEILRWIVKFASFVHMCFFFLYTRTVTLCIFLGACTGVGTYGILTRKRQQKKNATCDKPLPAPKGDIIKAWFFRPEIPRFFGHCRHCFFVFVSWCCLHFCASVWSCIVSAKTYSLLFCLCVSCEPTCSKGFETILGSGPHIDFVGIAALFCVLFLWAAAACRWRNRRPPLPVTIAGGGRRSRCARRFGASNFGDVWGCPKRRPRHTQVVDFFLVLEMQPRFRSIVLNLSDPKWESTERLMLMEGEETLGHTSHCKIL